MSDEVMDKSDFIVVKPTVLLTDNNEMIDKEEGWF